MVTSRVGARESTKPRLEEGMSWEKRKKDSSVFQFGLSLEVYMYTCGVLVSGVWCLRYIPSSASSTSGPMAVKKSVRSSMVDTASVYLIWERYSFRV